MSPWISFGNSTFALTNVKGIKAQNHYESQILHYIEEWRSGKEDFTFQTSGSTGVPKKISISRSQIEASIRGTARALDLKPAMTSLLCINPEFIGGRMMIYRSLVLNMNLLVAPISSNPIKNLGDCPIDFCAMVPLQVSTLINKDSEKEALSNIAKVIIGGGAVSKEIESELKYFDNDTYTTYGMTETVSHIALRKISGKQRQEYFRVLDGIKIYQDNRKCLIIEGAVTNHRKVITNDIVEIFDDKHFKWHGRFDNVINTGGIKIQAEALEEKVNKILRSLDIHNAFFISKIEDKQYGEKIILIMEGNSVNEMTILHQLRRHLDRYEVPKEIFFVNQFSRTPTGKIDRSATSRLIDY